MVEGVNQQSPMQGSNGTDVSERERDGKFCSLNRLDPIYGV